MSDQFVQLDLVDPVLGEVDLEGVPQGHHLELRELVLLKREMYFNNFSSDRQSLYIPASSQASQPFSRPSSLSSYHLGLLLA